MPQVPTMAAILIKTGIGVATAAMIGGAGWVVSMINDKAIKNADVNGSQNERIAVIETHYEHIQEDLTKQGMTLDQINKNIGYLINIQSMGQTMGPRE